MPRMDAHIPPEELQAIRNEQGDAYRRIARMYDYIYSTPQVAGPDESHAWPFGGRMEGPAFSLPYSPRNRCSCWPYQTEGCSECRPALWQRCSCGSHVVCGTECACYVTCDRCDNRFPESGGVQVVAEDGGYDTYYCETECAESAGYSECEECSHFTGHGSGVCQDCRPCECGDCHDCRARTNIHSYSYKPSPLFHGTGPVFLGLECEVNTGDSPEPLWRISRHVQNAVGNVAYLKSDSSIGTGFELVTHPMSYEYALERFPWGVFADLTGTFRVDENDSCGIHVHVSRAGFSGPGHLYRWQKFIYRNQQAVQAIARRRSSNWAAFHQTQRDMALWVAKTGGLHEYVSPDAWYAPAAYRGRYFSSQRYSAINLQNAQTLEVRVFAGSLKPVEIQAALGLVNGSVEYTRTLTSESILKKGGWDFRAFADWASGKSEYASLTSEIEKRV